MSKEFLVDVVMAKDSKVTPWLPLLWTTYWTSMTMKHVSEVNKCRPSQEWSSKHRTTREPEILTKGIK